MPTLDQAARACAEELFTSGSPSREKAERLVLTTADGRDLGGWGFEPAVDRIARHMADLLAQRDAELSQARAENERLRDKLSERMPT